MFHLGGTWGRAPHFPTSGLTQTPVSSWGSKFDRDSYRFGSERGGDPQHRLFLRYGDSIAPSFRVPQMSLLNITIPKGKSSKKRAKRRCLEPAKGRNMGSLDLQVWLSGPGVPKSQQGFVMVCLKIGKPNKGGRFWFPFQSNPNRLPSIQRRRTHILLRLSCLGQRLHRFSQRGFNAPIAGIFFAAEALKQSHRIFGMFLLYFYPQPFQTANISPFWFCLK